jgi:hypothetical protein
MRFLGRKWQKKIWVEGKRNEIRRLAGSARTSFRTFDFAKDKAWDPAFAALQHVPFQKLATA